MWIKFYEAFSVVPGDRELLESLMFDAEATRGAMSGWLKENVQDTPNGATFRRYVERHAPVSASPRPGRRSRRDIVLGRVSSFICRQGYGKTSWNFQHRPAMA